MHGWMKNAIPTGLAYPLIRGKEGSPKNIEENKKSIKCQLQYIWL